MKLNFKNLIKLDYLLLLALLMGSINGVIYVFVEQPYRAPLIMASCFILFGWYASVKDKSKWALFSNRCLNPKQKPVTILIIFIGCLLVSAHWIGWVGIFAGYAIMAVYVKLVCNSRLR